MNVTIRPSVISGRVDAPPSKSMAHRMLICAGLADGVSTVSGIAFSQDILATIDCLTALGAGIEINGDTVTVRGTDPSVSVPGIFDCRESGSTLRFFVPLCAVSGSEMTMKGSERLLSRPMTVYEDIFRERGLLFDNNGKEIRVRGRLTGGEFVLDAGISSQFITGMLFTLPLLEEDSILRLLPPVESRSYIDMTLAALRTFGITVIPEDDHTITIPGRQRYSPVDVRVEGDWSNAAFLIAMGADVRGLDPDSTQGDKICTEFFRMLDEGRAEIDISDCPDLGPVLMAYAAMRNGAVLHGTARLRIKESDRGMVMKEELSKFGVRTEVLEDSIIVSSGIHAPDEPLCGHNDHRIVMALSVLCSVTGGTITGAEAVNKSFPDYFDAAERLGMQLALS